MRWNKFSLSCLILSWDTYLLPVPVSHLQAPSKEKGGEFLIKAVVNQSHFKAWNRWPESGLSWVTSAPLLICCNRVQCSTKAYLKSPRRVIFLKHAELPCVLFLWISLLSWGFFWEPGRKKLKHTLKLQPKVECFDLVKKKNNVFPAFPSRMCFITILIVLMQKKKKTKISEALLKAALICLELEKKKLLCIALCRLTNPFTNPFVLQISC